MIVSDNDANQAEQFELVKRQINDAKFTAAIAPGLSLDGKIPVTVLMLPIENVAGNLETMCIESTRRAHRFVADRVDDFIRDLNADSWDVEKKGKLWLRVALSAAHKPDPFIFLGSSFRNIDLEHLIPLDHSSFSGLKAELEKFLQ